MGDCASVSFSFDPHKECDGFWADNIECHIIELPMHGNKDLEN